MTMPLANCLPDFGPESGPRSIEDHTKASPAVFKMVQGTPKPSAPARITKSTSGPAKSGSAAPGSTLKSVVRHIKLVNEPEFVTPIIEPAPPVDIDALLKEHGDKIRQEEAQKAKENLDAAIAAERKAHEEARMKERAQWVEKESALLAQQISSSLLELETDLSDSIARIFTPFIKSAVQDGAIAKLRAIVHGLINENGQAKIEVSGPSDLVEAIRLSLSNSDPDRIGQITFTVTAKTDVRVTSGDKVCTTQLNAWNERIASALSGQ